jgi:hypothetical protein
VGPWRSILFGEETTADGWIHSQEVEIVAADRLPQDHLRFLAPVHSSDGQVPGRDSIEYAREPVPEGFEIGIGGRSVGVAVVLAEVDLHQGGDVLHRDAFQHDPVHHAEDGCVRADPQRQREGGDQGEARRTG